MHRIANALELSPLCHRALDWSQDQSDCTYLANLKLQPTKSDKSKGAPIGPESKLIDSQWHNQIRVLILVCSVCCQETITNNKLMHCKRENYKITTKNFQLLQNQGRLNLAHKEKFLLKKHPQISEFIWAKSNSSIYYRTTSIRIHGPSMNHTLGIWCIGHVNFH